MLDLRRAHCDAWEIVIVVKDMHTADLLEIYGGLLTKKQFEMMDMYFCGDLSFGEISENLEISKQAVSDCISKCTKKLKEYESVLHMEQRYLNTKSLLTAIEHNEKDIGEKAENLRRVWEEY